MLINRRHFLQTAGAGFGSLALRSLLDQDGLLAATPNPLAAKTSLVRPRAKSVIFLFMYGGPSQVDTFDPKPELTKWHGKEIPVFDKKDAFFAETKATGFGTPYEFKQHGESGLPVSSLFPQLAKHADDLCVIRSMYADSNNHGPALFQVNSGQLLSGFPTMGSWITYGLGSASENLPGYVVLMDHQGAPVNGALNWTNGFMPASYQGVPFRSSGAPIANLKNAEGVSSRRQRDRLDLLNKWNRDYAERDPGEDDLAARVTAYELAYRMQMHAPEVTDLSTESAATKKLYGMENKTSEHFGRNCLLARRLVERGVRFVQLYSGGDRGPTAWDAHKQLKENHDRQSAQTDQPIAGLLSDLKQRGLLDQTLVVWGGEFGRLPTHQGEHGRDHNPFGFTYWLAGGGTKPGMTYGATDDFGYRAVENKVHVHDLHATMLDLLGLDHEKLTYHFNGRDYRLTDVAGNVVEAILDS